ncbi:MAG TPA: hypothetical protein VL175_20285 [Pirellulales bacterium]|nr:hypothetical protein [Pirellulales bacterium]
MSNDCRDTGPKLACESHLRYHGADLSVTSTFALAIRKVTMARKILNRKELREETDAAEREGKAKKKVAKPEEDGKKKPVKRKSRAKTAKEVRLKAFWGVFNQSMKRVALFEYSQRKQADKKAAELSTSAKTPHFVQPVKEVIEE